MLTGFNTDIEFNGQVFHVQTEDRGLAHPVVDSLVYSGGAIITSRKVSYADLAAAPDFKESDVLRQMETQHRELIREIRNGRFASEPLKPFGHSLISNRSFDEVVLGFLHDQVPLEAIEVRIAESGPGRFEVRESSTERPVVGASVIVQLVTAQGESRQLLSATTDERGTVDVTDIPDVASGVLLCEAEASGKRASVRRPLVRAGADSTHRA